MRHPSPRRPQPKPGTVRHSRHPTTHRRRRADHRGQVVLRRRHPDRRQLCFRQAAQAAWFGWRTIAPQSLPLLSAAAPLPRRAASMRASRCPHRLPRRPGQAGRGSGRGRDDGAAERCCYAQEQRKRRSRRAVRTIAATSTSMALHPGARSGSTIGQRAVTRETTSRAYTVAGASRPISGKHRCPTLSAP